MENKLPYDPANKESVIKYAQGLVGKSLRQACDITEENAKNFLGKGNFGQTLEKYYFLYEPNSESQPDFPGAGLELKSTPLKQLQNKEYRAKERLVLNIIDYMKIVDQNFDTSSFWCKNANLLLVFYLYQKNLNFMDYVIQIVDEWDFPEADKNVIKQDWEFIKAKVQAGHAHELSEGDTYYLGACPKGKDSNSKRKQPNSDEMAMQRAFSFKASYVNHIIASIVGNKRIGYGKAIPSLCVKKEQTIEDAIINKFKKYYGKSASDIQKSLGIELNIGSKSFYSSLCDRIQEFEEIDKAGILVKTVILPEGSNPPRENMSFPAFKYEELVSESWEDSSFKEILESKFLFVFFQKIGGDVILRKVKIWNMPYADIQEAKKVWDKTREVVGSGNIVKSVDELGVRRTNFPGKTFNKIAHVRPHATTTKDTYPLPVVDKVTHASEYTKHSFWLNNRYILEIYRDK